MCHTADQIFVHTDPLNSGTLRSLTNPAEEAMAGVLKFRLQIWFPAPKMADKSLVCVFQIQGAAREL